MRSTFAPIFVALALFFGTNASAFCFDQAAARFGVDPLLLKGVAHVESSMQAGAINTSHFARTHSVDLGLMQINSSWLPKLASRGITREALLSDPCLNLNVGAEILSGSLNKFGMNWTGVGAYNAACTQLKGDDCTSARALYANKVWRAMALYSGGKQITRPHQPPATAVTHQSQAAQDPDTRMRVF
jgi:hypothetical protein